MKIQILLIKSSAEIFEFNYGQSKAAPSRWLLKD